MTTRRVTIDPDGSQAWGLFVIVDAPTGTSYEIQTAGHAVEQRRSDGYLVPTGDAASARPLQDFFTRAFKGNPPSAKSNGWSKRSLDDLAALVNEIPYWSKRADGSDQRNNLVLDTDRVRELTEGWIPVRLPDGKGVLVFKNSD